MIKVWYSPQDVADLNSRGKLHGPKTKAGVISQAKREGWYDAEDLVSRRKGKGGGVAFHVTRLSDQQQAFAMAESGKQIVAKDHSETRALQDQKRGALVTTELSARQRDVMAARAARIALFQAGQGLFQDQTQNQC